MKGVSLYGWNAKFNAGDDAMTQVMVAHFQRLYGEDVPIRIMAERSRLPFMKGNIKGNLAVEQVNKIPGFRTWCNINVYGRSFVKSDLLIFGGGSIFHDSKNTQYFDALYSNFKKQGGKKAGSLGVSVGPFPNEHSKIVNLKFLESLDFVVVRDEKSFNILRENDLQTNYIKAIDLAILYPRYFSLKLQEKKNKIGVSLRSKHHSADELKKLADALIEMQKQMPQHTFVLYQFCAYESLDDIIEINQLVKLISNKVKYEVFDFTLDTIKFYESISSLDLMIATRLHAAIMAYTVNTPTVILSYHEKCREFADMVGMDQSLILNSDDLDISLLLNKSKEIVLNKAQAYTLAQDKAADISALNFSFI